MFYDLPKFSSRKIKIIPNREWNIKLQTNVDLNSIPSPEFTAASVVDNSLDRIEPSIWTISRSIRTNLSRISGVLMKRTTLQHQKKKKVEWIKLLSFSQRGWKIVTEILMKAW